MVKLCVYGIMAAIMFSCCLVMPVYLVGVRFGAVGGQEHLGMLWLTGGVGVLLTVIFTFILFVDSSLDAGGSKNARNRNKDASERIIAYLFVYSALITVMTCATSVVMLGSH